jgi:hypothetical protein
MIRCPTCGLEWSPGTLTCPKDGTRLPSGLGRALVETLPENNPGVATSRQSRSPTPLETVPLGGAETAPTTWDASLPPPMLNPPSDLRSGPKRALGAPPIERASAKNPPGSLPPEPKSGGKLVPAGAAPGVGQRPTANAELEATSTTPTPRPSAPKPFGALVAKARNTGPRPAADGRNTGPRPAHSPAAAPIERNTGPRPVAAAAVQPLPVAKNDKNPWGDEQSGGTDSTLKRQHRTPKTVVHAPEPQKDPLIGVKLGEYTVLDQLGAGGMGIVYRGEQPLIGKQVAIKVLRPELASDPRQVQRLVDEARAVNAVHHPGLINIFSFGETPDGAKYFVMDLLEGQSLEELLISRGRLKAWEAVPILEGACAALDAAHGAGVIHRDLKPSNIFLVDLPDHTARRRR